MALEDDAVKTGEDGDDQAGKLGDEARQRLHGVLLRTGAGANPILAGERLSCSAYLVAAMPRWERCGRDREEGADLSGMIYTCSELKGVVDFAIITIREDEYL